MQTLTRSVFKGDVPPPQLGADVNNNQVAQMEVRISQIEEQLRRLTGMIEENSFQLRRLSETGMTGNVSPLQTQSSMNGIQAVPLDTMSTNTIPSAPVIDNANQGQYQLGTLNAGAMSPAKMYDQAFSYLQRNDYASAQATFDEFIMAYPNHALVENAKYWLGETYYARDSYSEASRAFARAFKDHPDGQKAPDTLLKLAMSLQRQDMTQEACLTLGELENRFPNAPSSVAAKAREEEQIYGCS